MARAAAPPDRVLPAAFVGGRRGRLRPAVVGEAAEPAGDTSFTSLWSGQAAGLARELPAGDLTRVLAADALQLLH